MDTAQKNFELTGIIAEMYGAIKNDPELAMEHLAETLCYYFYLYDGTKRDYQDGVRLGRKTAEIVAEAKRAMKEAEAFYG